MCIKLTYKVQRRSKAKLGKIVPVWPKDVNKDEQNRRFCWPISQLILMLGILIGGRFWDSTCLIWNFLIWKQQNLHIKENDQHLVQLLPNKLVTPFITVLLVSINVFGVYYIKSAPSFSFSSLMWMGMEQAKPYFWLHCKKAPCTNNQVFIT